MFRYMSSLENRSEQALPTRRRGPKPLGDRSMTPAERQQRSRDRLRHDGGHLWTVRIPAEKWAHLEKWPRARDERASQLLGQLLGSVIDRFIAVNDLTLAMMRAGATAQEAADFHQQQLFPSLPSAPTERDSNAS